MKYLWYLNLNASFSVALHFPRNLHVNPLPKAVSLHCAPPSRFTPPPVLIIIAQSLTMRLSQIFIKFAHETDLTCDLDSKLNERPPKFDNFSAIEILSYYYCLQVILLQIKTMRQIEVI